MVMTEAAAQVNAAAAQAAAQLFWAERLKRAGCKAQESAGADVYFAYTRVRRFHGNAADGVFSADGLQRGVKNREGKTQEPVKTDAYYNIIRSRKYAIFSCSGL